MSLYSSTVPSDRQPVRLDLGLDRKHPLDLLGGELLEGLGDGGLVHVHRVAGQILVALDRPLQRGQVDRLDRGEQGRLERRVVDQRSAAAGVLVGVELLTGVRDLDRPGTEEHRQDEP